MVDKHLEPGDSGSLVIKGGSIVGHYHGAVYGRGVVCIWPTYLEKYLSKLANSHCYDSRFVQEVDATSGFAVIDYFDTKSADSNAPSAERKTELFDAFASMGIESNKLPASQSQEALKISIDKWQPVEEYFDSDYAVAAEELCDHLSLAIRTRSGECQPFETWEDAINGQSINEDRVLKKVEMSTSAGAPWCDNAITKDDLIDASCYDRLKPKPEFEQLLNDIETKFKNGDAAGYTATANLKDELREIEKVQQKKTRLFCATPLHHNILFRKYYGRWIKAFKSLPYKDGMHAMGCDVFGDDWNELYDYLMSPPVVNESQGRHPIFMAGDFSRFDTSHSGWKLRKAFKVAAGSCSDQYMCDVLAQSICRFGLRYHDREFRVPAGLPSGCQMTTPINCILNTLLWLTVWRKLTGGDLQSFIRETRLVCYGDDVVFGIDQFNPRFKYLNPRKIQDVMKNLGYVIEGPRGGDLEWQPIEAITFLKRNFVKDPISPNIVHAPRPKMDIYTQLMWRCSDATLESQECCFRAFAMEVGQHDKTTQREMISNVIEAVRRSKSDLCREALANSNIAQVVKRAYAKQLALEDILRMRLLFWRLW